MSLRSEQLSSTLISGLILCGGKAERMGGQDKGLVPLKGQTMVTWVAKTLQPQVALLRINANRHLDTYRELGFEVVPDVITDFAGPLAGFHAGLKKCEKPYLLVVPCDSPLLPNDLAEKLLSHLQTHDLDLVYAGTKDVSRPNQVQTHPVFCLMKSSVLKSLEDFLGRGERKIDRWFKDIKTDVVLFADDLAFSNINTPNELESISKLLP